MTTTQTPSDASGSPTASKSSLSAEGSKSSSGSIEKHGTTGGAALKTEHGTTSISSSVVAKIAGIAAQEIPGVQAMGKSMTRAIGSLRSKVPGGGSSATTQGVSVEVGETQAAVDIDIVVYYGQSIVETADAIRENVIDRIESLAGLEVVEVNITVDDLYLEADGEGDGSSSRVE